MKKPDYGSLFIAFMLLVAVVLLILEMMAYWRIAVHGFK